jgi:cation diffusion facilitator family transporter
MTGCGCHTADATAQRRTLRIALALNAAMFVIGLAAGLAAQSSGLIADALDMLADASAYGIALMAIRRSDLFKARAARLSGTILLVLGLGVVLDAGRRLIFGSAPEGMTMMTIAALSLAVNASVLHLLSRERSQEVHIRATFIFTRADVVANIGVILSGLIVYLAGFHRIDPIAGIAIGLYVGKEALEILRQAGRARTVA